MIAEIQCLPSPAGTPESAYAHIEAAIAVVADSGLTYEVGALGTTLEGSPDEVWAVLRRAHEATLADAGATAAGAESVVSVLKVFQSAPRDAADTSPQKPGIDDLVAAHR
jgi:uncharacterized protein YqgV (UPF0045/DUF77 family)